MMGIKALTPYRRRAIIKHTIKSILRGGAVWELVGLSNMGCLAGNS